MPWFYLVLAGLLEIVWTVGLKYTEGFSRLVPSIVTVIAMYVSFWFLSISLKTIPISIAYAVWCGIGIVGTVIMGMLWFAESVNVIKILCIGLILLGIAGLKLISPT